MKAASQKRFDPVDLKTHVSGGKPRDLGDRTAVEVLEIQKHQLAIDRIETVDQAQNPVEGNPLFDATGVIGRIRGICRLRDFFKRDEVLQIRPELPDNVGDAGVVGHPKDPGHE